MKNDSQFINLERIYKTTPEKLFKLFENGSVFRLTGADEIQVDFKPNGLFNLIFKERGKIYGRFIKIESNELNIDWNVNGFGLPDEVGTFLEISLQKENDNCKLILCHKYVSNKDSAIAKRRAWGEILDNIFLQI